MAIEDTVMAIDEARFRQAMGYFASGVTIVTTTHEEKNYGMTVSSFSSLSLRPPLVLVCIDKRVSTHDVIPLAGGFVINILEESQEHLSRKFASPEGDKYNGVAWRRGVLGLPILEGVLSSVECRLYDTLPGGDHTIFVGEVVESTIGEGAPLLYYRRGYHELK